MLIVKNVHKKISDKVISAIEEQMDILIKADPDLFKKENMEKDLDEIEIFYKYE